MWFISEPKADSGHTTLSPSSLLRTWVTRQSKTSLVFWAFSDVPREFCNTFLAVTIWHILHPFHVEWCFSHYLPRRQTHMHFVGKTKMDENTGMKWETHWRFERTLLSSVEFLRGLRVGWKIWRAGTIPSGFRFGVSRLQDDTVSRAWPWKDRWGSLLAKHWSSKWNKDGKNFLPLLFRSDLCSRS